MVAAEKTFQDAITALNAGKFHDAERLFRTVLDSQPGHAGALNLLTVLLSGMQRYAEAEEFGAKAAKLDQASDLSFYNYGIILKRLGKPGQALEQFDNALQRNARVAETWNNRGTVHNDLRQYEAAISDFDEAISLNANYYDAFYNKGQSLGELRRHDEAISAYGKALALKPDFAEAWLGRGNVCVELKRYDEASSAYDQALKLKPGLRTEVQLGRGRLCVELGRRDEALSIYDAELTLKPDLAEARLGRGNVFYDLNRYDEALSDFDEALKFKPDLPEAWLGRGNVLNKRNRFDEAVLAFDKALTIRPDLAEAWLGRGNAFTAIKLYDRALSAYDKALALKPDLAAAHLGLGRVFTELNRYDDAFVAYDKALALKPDLPNAEGARLNAKIQLCDWTNFDSERTRLISSIKNGIQALPFPLLAISDSPDEQLTCATLFVKENFPIASKSKSRPPIDDHRKIRIAYLSADFREHAVGYLLAGMLEHHDHDRFEVIAISLRPAKPSEMLTRMKTYFDRFVDASSQSDDDAARLLETLEVDIAVDLMGHTLDSRTAILAHRSAPIQVNYLGYPGTMGADYIDYIIGDRFIIPDSQRCHYSEKIAYLPDTFQANQSERKASDRFRSRAEAGLPDDGFVFCSFNNNYKITPAMFDTWMKLIGKVDGSVLWLLEGNADVKRNLQREAKVRGIDPSRLIFAPRIEYADYLARYRLADLFLDTAPFNAGTTASDALWTGVPLVTCSGRAFASRMAGSLLTAIGMPELITHTTEDYEALAYRLACNPDLMTAVKAKLERSRLSSPLFNAPVFTRNIEAAYTAMYERYQAGLAPDHIYVTQKTD
jgi:protein O-GlcNAc transferase